MGQRQAFLLATFLTTFGLILIGAVAFRLTNTSTDTPEVTVVDGATAPLVSTDSTTATVLTPDQQTVNELAASRQLAYEQALAQANAQLQTANEQLAQLQGGLVNSTGQVPASASASSSDTPFAVSVEGAGQIALAVVPNTTITATPILVDFQGTVAYEVATNAGLLYIDATTGTILFNGAVPAPATQAPLPASQPQAPATNTTTTVAPTAILAPASAPAPTTISEEQALAIATSAVGPGTVDKMKLEDEHGILIWDIKFTNDNEVRIDAYTGTIVRTRIENDND